MSKLEQVIYPPLDILDPVIGKADYEYIVLWMLNNNSYCTWADFTAKMSGSTLHGYIIKLLNRDYIKKPQKGKYQITLEGRNRFSELVYDKKLGKRSKKYPPKQMLKRRNYDHWILWMLYNNHSCKWSDFKQKPLLINQTSLSNTINSLLDKGFITKVNKDYIITANGQNEYINVLKSYDLDRQSILEQESKRIEDITDKTSQFFFKYNIKDNKLKFRYIDYSLKLFFSKVKGTLKNEEDFKKILLFLTLNHPDQYPEYISPEIFSKKYEIEIEILNYYILEIVDKEFFGIKFFKIEDERGAFYYFHKNEPLEKMLNVIVEKFITQLTYLNKFQEKPSLDIELLLQNILNEICGNLFDLKLKNSLENFLPDYIKYLAYKIETEKKLINTEAKLEGFIWQNVFEGFQTFSQSNLSKIEGELEEYSYFLDKRIFDVLETFYLTKLNFINTNEVQEAYKLKNNKIFREISNLIYRNEISKARNLYEKNLNDLNEIHQLILKDILNTTEYNFNESILITTEIIQKYPKEFIGYLLQSITHFLMDNYEKSLETIEIGLKETQNFLLFCQKVQVFIKNSRGEELLDEIDKELLRYPNNSTLLRVKLLIFLTHSFDFAKNQNIVLSIINLLIKLSPNDFELFLLKSIFYLQMNKYKQATKFLIEEVDFNIFSRNPQIDISLFFLLVFTYTARGKYDDAQKMANLLGSIYPNHPISYLAKALVYGYNVIYKFGNEEPDINKFLELINQAISLEHLNYNKIKFLHLQISILDGLKQYEKLIDTINYAIKLIPTLFYFYNLKIYYLTITRRELEALELTDELIKSFPDLKYKVNERKTSILFKLERYEEALEINNELIKLYPDKIEYINNQAMILGYSGKKKEAIETAEHLIRLNPNISNSYDTFGNVYMVFEEYKKAIDKFEEALRLDPSNILNFHTYLRLGICYKELKNYEKAHECFEKGKILTERMIPSLKEYYLPETQKQLSELESIMNQSENLKAEEKS